MKALYRVVKSVTSDVKKVGQAIKDYPKKFTGKASLPESFKKEYKKKARMSSDGGWINK
jgi:hypothetical protein